MKKILFLHANLDVGGAEIMRLFLLRNIDRTKYDIRLCCIEKKGVLGREIEKLGYAVDELKENPNSLSIKISCKLAKYLKRERPDILHSSLFKANFHARIASLLYRIPHIITEEHGEHKQYKGIKFFPYILLDFFLSRLNDSIICCSDRLKTDIIKKERLPCGKIMSIENCLDVNIYKFRLKRDEVRKIHDISNEMAFITTASLKEGKGHDYLIDVLCELRALGFRFRYFFAGDGPLKENLKLKVKSLKLEKEIIFLGKIDNIADYLNASDVFVLPSFSEGLSIALMEAMLIGLPSIVTDVGSNPDLIKTGFNGSVVSSGSAKELKEAMVFYLKNRNLIKEFGERSQSIIKEKYSSIYDYVRKYYELWDKCGSNKR